MPNTLEEIKYMVTADLESLSKMADNLLNRLPSIGSAVPSELYLEATGIHVLIVSQLEYLLKSAGKIKRQSDIPRIIQNNNSLNQLEKDHLIYLFLTRHTIVHNGSHYDDKFFEDAKTLIKQLKLDIPKSHTSLSLIGPEQIKMYIDLVMKFISSEF